MLKIQEIREIIKLIDKSSIDEFVYKANGTEIKMKKNNEVIAAVNKNVAETPAPVVETNQAPIKEAIGERQIEVERNILKDEVEQNKQLDHIEDGLVEIVSPMVGTFYVASSPGAEPYVKVGEKVSEGTVVCIVEAMKLFNEIEAEVTGEIAEVLVSDGQLVEYGQPLFLVKPE